MLVNLDMALWFTTPVSVGIFRIASSESKLI